MRDRVAALPIETSKLRLYCLRLSYSVLIVGNESSKTYNEDEILNGYVVNLQKLDEIIQQAEKKGTIVIEETSIEEIDDKTFEL